MKSFRPLTYILVSLFTVMLIGGAFATFVYQSSPPDDVTGDVSLSLNKFEYYEGGDYMEMAEELVTNKFVTEMTTMLKSPNSTRLDEVIEARKDRGGWFMSPKEFAANDVAGESVELRQILELDKYPELTVIIKFVSGTPGYELFTTRVNVDAKDENGNFVIPEEEFSEETTFIYPVNRTTFKSDGKGGYVVDHVTVGYSRAIYYYETATAQNTTRTYDVSTWAEGNSFSTAVEIESGIVGKEITVQNIDKEKTAYFKFKVPSRGRYKFSTTTPGLTGLICNSSGVAVTGNLSTNTNYYLKLTYSAQGEAENFKFTLST
ncbi:MAG: hypothetical protein J6V66_07200 [Clostridia bacterium]|nr:hypothetical protein [Clostridia bacterium]